MKILKVKCLAPTRLDNYLTQQYPALTPGRLNKALRDAFSQFRDKEQTHFLPGLSWILNKKNITE